MTASAVGPSPQADASPTTTTPHVDTILPATGGPAGVGIVGAAAAGAGLVLRAITRDERRAELDEST